MVVLPFSHLYTIQENFFGQRIWDNLWCYCPKYLGCTFLGPFCFTSLLEYNLYSYFCLSSFWPRTLQELEYLLWFMLISLYGCHASFWFAMGHFDWPITKNIVNPTPFPLQKKWHVLTLFYTNTKSYKCNCFTLTCPVFYIYTYTNINRPYKLTRNVNKIHYGIYIYMECKS
jgi:hypothetical protein